MELEQTKNKTCKQCGRLLPVTMFYRQKSNKDGYQCVCKECHLKKRKEYYHMHKTERQEYYINNRDKILERQKKYYKEHCEDIKNYIAVWKKEHSEQTQIRKRRQNRQRRKAEGSFTIEQWNECVAFFNNTCAYSGEEFEEEFAEKMSEEHIIPLSKNGNNFIWNIIPVKLKYNSSRGNKLIKEWYEEQSFYSEERLNLIREWRKYAHSKWGA